MGASDTMEACWIVVARKWVSDSLPQKTISRQSTKKNLRLIIQHIRLSCCVLLVGQIWYHLGDPCYHLGSPHGQAYQVRVVGADSPGAASPCSPGSRAMSEDPSSAESSCSNVQPGKDDVKNGNNGILEGLNQFLGQPKSICKVFLKPIWKLQTTFVFSRMVFVPMCIPQKAPIQKSLSTCFLTFLRLLCKVAQICRIDWLLMVRDLNRILDQCKQTEKYQNDFSILRPAIVTPMHITLCVILFLKSCKNHT